MGFFNDANDTINKASIKVNQVATTVGQGAIITDYASSAFGLGNISYVAAAVPIWGIADSTLGMVNTVTALLSGADIIKKLPTLNKVGRLGSDILLMASNINLLINSLDALAAGTVVPVYYGLAIKYGIQFAKNIYFYSLVLKEINAVNNAPELNPGEVTTKGDKINFTSLAKRKNLWEERAFWSAMNCIGFTCLTVGYPIGFAFLALATLKSSFDFFEIPTTNPFNFKFFPSATAKKADLQNKPPEPNPAPSIR